MMGLLAQTYSSIALVLYVLDYGGQSGFAATARKCLHLAITDLLAHACAVGAVPVLDHAWQNTILHCTRLSTLCCAGLH